MKNDLFKCFLITGIIVLSAQMFMGRVEAKSSTADNADGYKAMTYKLTQENHKLIMQIVSEQKELRKLAEDNNTLLLRLDARLGGVR